VSGVVIEGGWVIPGGSVPGPIEAGHLAIVDGVIVSVGPGTAPASVPRDDVIDAEGCLVVPGLVNAHTHLCMTLGRSLGTDASLLQWLTTAQLPLMSVLEPEDYELAVTLGALENLRSGNTTVCEVFFSNRFGDATDGLAAAALDRLGLRSILFRCSNDLPFAPGFVESLDDIGRRSSALIDEWSASTRTGIGVGPIVPWAATPDYWAQTREFADSGVGVHLHTAETPEYNDLIAEQTGLTNIGLLADVGVLGPGVMLNHCIHLSEADIALIADHGSPVIHDPTSNMILASGVAPVPALRAAGVTVGLACDGPACHNTQDMFEVMKAASLLHKVTTRDPTVLTASDVFTMATAGGAAAAGLGGVTGALEVGLAGDVVVVDARSAHLVPMHDPLAALVYSARAADVRDVVIDGEVVLRDGVVLNFDEEELLVRAQLRARELAQAAGL